MTIFLWIEDSLNDVLLVRRELDSVPNIALHTVRDGVEAQHYLMGLGQYADRKQFPLPDVILLDLRMPRLHGFAFLEWLRRDAPTAMRRKPVVVISSSGTHSDITNAYQLGANSYLIKPQRLEEFRQCMKALVTCWELQSIGVPPVRNPRQHAAELTAA